MKTFYRFSSKNVLFFLILIFGIAAGTFADPQYYNYNNGTVSNSFPLNINTGKMIQTLMLPGEFTQPSAAPSGNITSLSLFISPTYPLTPTTYTNFRILFLDTNLTSLPAGFVSGNWDTVYSSVSVQFTANGGSWLDIPLNHNHAYLNTQSLVIQIEQCSASGATSGVFSLLHSNVSANRRSYSVGGCPFSYQGQSLYVVDCGVNIAPPVSVCSFACTPQTSGTTSLLQAVSTVSNLVGWVGGAAATVRRTTDGGTTWTNGNSTPGIITGDIYNMYATDANNCLCTTSPGATFIYRTTNGGTTWTQVFTQPTPGFMDAIVMTSSLTGYAYGDPVAGRWSLWRTTNGGASWDSTLMYLPQAGTEAGWNNSMKAIGTNIWFGTSNTRVYHSVNGGLTWTFGATTGDANSYSLHFNSLTEGIVGTGTVVTKTINGGTTYATVTALGTGNVTGFSGGALTDYFYTRGNNIYMTTNSGTTWTTPYTGTQALNGVDMQTVTGCPRGWAVGSAGTIIKIGNDTLVSVGNNNSQLPETYSLLQNYPNPFNPSTEISFALPTKGLVQLKVYDVVGREVTTLVNEFRQAGNYKVEFNASAFASGVYFYTLKSGDFVETKKMVLIK